MKNYKEKFEKQHKKSIDFIYDYVMKVDRVKGGFIAKDIPEFKSKLEKLNWYKDKLLVSKYTNK